MSQTWQGLAQDIADRWGAPRKHAPIASLDYVADQAYWQAVNRRGFTGDFAAWCQAIRDRLPEGAPQPQLSTAQPTQSSRVSPSSPPETVTPPDEGTPAPSPTAQEAEPAVSDSDDWLSMI